MTYVIAAFLLALGLLVIVGTGVTGAYVLRMFAGVR